MNTKLNPKYIEATEKLKKATDKMHGLLTLKQFDKIIFKYPSLYFRAEAIKKISKSKKVHMACDQVMAAVLNLKSQPKRIEA